MAKDGELRVIQGGVEAAGQLTRRELVQRLFAGAAWPIVSAAHPFYKHLENGTAFDVQDQIPIVDWKPAFLNQFENRSLVVLAERIVPGSEKAKVNRFVDLLLSVDAEKHQKNFVDALAAFEVEAGKRFGKRLPALDRAQLDEFLTVAAAGPEKKDSLVEAEKEDARLHEHFENLKGWISGAYYSSETGMRELGWTGDYAFDKFPGCEHPEGHS